MTEYTIYETATGLIIRTGATNGDPSTKVKAGQSIIYVRSLSPKTQEVVNGELVDI